MRNCIHCGLYGKFPRKHRLVCSPCHEQNRRGRPVQYSVSVSIQGNIQLQKGFMDRYNPRHIILHNDTWTCGPEMLDSKAYNKSHESSMSIVHHTGKFSLPKKFLMRHTPGRITFHTDGRYHIS